MASYKQGSVETGTPIDPEMGTEKPIATVARQSSVLDRHDDPFAQREGKTLTWRNVNMTLVSKKEIGRLFNRFYFEYCFLTHLHTNTGRNKEGTYAPLTQGCLGRSSTKGNDCNHGSFRCWKIISSQHSIGTCF